MPEVKQAVPVGRCLGLLREMLGDNWTIRARQLYHDREEITVAVPPRR